MELYFAPLEGITGYIYRNAHHSFYGGIDKYFIPFISPNQNRPLTPKEIRDVLPEHNRGVYAVPQILTNRADYFLRAAKELEKEYGYREVNLNLGCPSRTVVSKGKGAGFLAKPKELDAFLQEIFENIKIKVSVKTDAATNIIDQAQAADIPVIFFNRSVSEEVISAYDKAAFVGTDYEMAGKMQGDMIGDYLVENFDKADLNGDGEISYVMFKGQQGNAEADARTEYAVKNANEKLKAAGKKELKFYDASNSDKYLLDKDGAWSAAQGTDLMQTVLSQYNPSNDNMVELVIANNDDMALGAISALENDGYNKSDSEIVIPVFGVDATDAAIAKIKEGAMTGTIKQDAEGMAAALCRMVQNMTEGKDKFDGLDAENVIGTWRINIPYSTYTGE